MTSKDEKRRTTSFTRLNVPYASTFLVIKDRLNHRLNLDKTRDKSKISKDNTYIFFLNLR